MFRVMALRLHSVLKQLTFCSQTKWCRVLFLFTCLVSTCCSLVDNRTNLVKFLLRNLDNNDVQGQFSDNKDTIKRHAVVEKSSPIPEQVFTGKFEVTEAGELGLPEWLLFDEGSQTFSAIPLTKDIGIYYIDIKAIGFSQRKTTSAKYTFLIEVVEDTEIRLADNEILVSDYANGEKQTKAYLVLDKLNVSDRLNIWKKLSSFLYMPLELFKLLPKIEKISVYLSAVFSGPQNANIVNKEDTLVELRIGNSLSITNEQIAMISKLGNTANDGSLSTVVGYPAHGWHVTNVFPRLVHRIRRQVGRDTPVTGVIPAQLFQQMSPINMEKTSETPNFKPNINKRIKKLTMVTGKVWKYQISQDIFVDMEDGNTRHLNLLFLTSERIAVQPTSWIQFDPEKQMLYALPLDEHIGKYEFILGAMDIEGAFTSVKLDIHVWQQQSTRAKHHEFSVSLKYNEKQYPITIDWNIKFAKHLARYYGDENERNIAVQDVSTEPVATFIWSNDSLPIYPCPREEIRKLINKLFANNSNEISLEFKETMASDFYVIDAGVNLFGACQNMVISTPPTQSKFPPVLRNAIEKLEISVGEILLFRIPDDTFYDVEDGSTKFLQLVFLTIDSVIPSKSSWVQFDPKSQELYGLPLDGDVGRHEYQLVSKDSTGLQVTDVFVIEVHKRLQKKWNVQFSLYIETDYEEFGNDIIKKILLVRKLAKLYGDPDPRYITVDSISKDSVVYTWTNNTLFHDSCQSTIINKLVDNILNENYSLSSKLVEAMKPEFKIIKAVVSPLGICLGEVIPTSVTTALPIVTGKLEPAAETDDNIYMTTIVPVIVLTVMPFFACFLYQKKREKTMQDNDTFIGNRLPIVFCDEVKEKSDPAKSPVIMLEEIDSFVLH